MDFRLPTQGNCIETWMPEIARRAGEGKWGSPSRLPESPAVVPTASGQARRPPHFWQARRPPHFRSRDGCASLGSAREIAF